MSSRALTIRRRRRRSAVALAAAIVALAASGRGEAGAAATRASADESVRLRQAVQRARDLDAAEAERLAARLAAGAEGVEAAEAHLLLASYHYGLHLPSAAAVRAWQREHRDARLDHVEQLVRQRPALEVAGTPALTVQRILDRDGYDRIKTVWLQQVAAHPDSARIHGNAARFLLLDDPRIARELLERAKAMEPDDPRWAQRLAQLYDIEARRGGKPRSEKAEAERREAARRALAAYEAAAQEPENRLTALAGQARAAFAAGAVDQAAVRASELLELASTPSDDPEHADAVHVGHTVLGRIALVRGDQAAALDHLQRSTVHGGSPRLSASGPNMSLARILLAAGESEAVVDYLERCRALWAAGGDRIDEWQVQIRTGRIPSFGPDLLY